MRKNRLKRIGVMCYVHLKILHNAIEKNVGMLNNHFRLKESEHAQMINLTGTDLNRLPGCANNYLTEVSR